MKTFNAFTTEIDDNAAAVTELVTALNPEENFGKHTLLLASFNEEYVENGMYEMLRKALPYDIIGGYTFNCGTQNSHGELSFSILALTGDDVEFKIACTPEINETLSLKEMDDEIRKLTDAVAGGENKVIFAYTSAFAHYATEDLLDILDQKTGGVPVFGTQIWNVVNKKSPVICNDTVLESGVVLAGVGGTLSPKFTVTSALGEKNFNAKTAGTITECDNMVLKKVNDIPIIEYLTREKAFHMKDLYVLPAVLLKREDKIFVVRAFIGDFGNLKPDSEITATGRLEQGALISFANLDKKAVLKSAEEQFKLFRKNKNTTTLNFSCTARSESLGTQSDAEFEAALASSKGLTQFNLAYSAGEICPVYGKGGRIINTLHSYSLVSCIFG